MMPYPALTRVFIGALCAAIIGTGPALADIPWGDWSRHQQAAIVYGYLQAPETSQCAALRETIALVSRRLQTKYELTIGDFNEESPLGRKFVRKGRLAAAHDVSSKTFCDDLDMDMGRATAELLLP